MTIDIKSARDIIAAAKLPERMHIKTDATSARVYCGHDVVAVFDCDNYREGAHDEERATFLVEAAKGWPAALDEIERLQAGAGWWGRAAAVAMRLGREEADRLRGEVRRLRAENEMLRADRDLGDVLLDAAHLVKEQL